MTLPQTTLTVLPEWIDHNGHMNVAYYVLAFDLVDHGVEIVNPFVIHIQKLCGYS